jgi:Ni/Fe-hydrogenase subunit HybB-like protein
MRALIGKMTFWRGVLAALLLAGAYAVAVRVFMGLGAATNLTDAFPWGLWIGFDVLCGVGLAAGGFTLCGVVYIFNLEHFRPVIRPAVLTAFLGYALVAVAITLDIGRPWRIWHPLVFWNHNSVMFEVAWCVTLYLTVLSLEFSPVVFDKFKLGWAKKLVKAINIPLVIAGILLSTLHQSSLGSLYLIVPTKLHPLWYSPLLPVLFYISAVGIGLAMVIVESSLSSRAFKRSLEMGVLSKLAKAAVVVLGCYGLLRFWDIYYRGSLGWLKVFSKETIYFYLEILLLVVLPVALLSNRKIRSSPRGLFGGAFCAVLGFVLNRLNVAITGMEWSRGVTYMPSWMEWAVTLSFAAGGFALFALAVKYLPVFQRETVVPGFEALPPSWGRPPAKAEPLPGRQEEATA